MCIPCAAAVPGLGEILLFILLGLLIAVGLCFKYVTKALPYVGMALGVVSVALYRWFSGAVLDKYFHVKDEDHWDMVTRQGHKGPRLTRPVRATARIMVTALAVGLLWNWVATAIIAGTLSVLVSGSAVYSRRDRVITTARELPTKARSVLTGKSTEVLEGEPIRVKVKVGAR